MARGQHNQDLKGMTFGKLKVIRLLGPRNTDRMWECKCECGKTNMVAQKYLHDGRIKSCGCLLTAPRPHAKPMSCKIDADSYRDYQRAYQRHKLLGWDCHDAKTLPVMPKGKRYRAV